jgi:hypothetical protein
MSEEHIKIHVSLPPQEHDGLEGESVWAIKKGIDIAQIDNIPFFVNLGLNDIVRFKIFNGINEYVETITKSTNTIGVTWHPSDDNEEKTKEEWLYISDYFRSHELPYESFKLGIFVIAVPIDITDDNILEIINNCDIELTPHFLYW